MTISELMALIRRNRERLIVAGKYTMQIYSNGIRGNIRRVDKTVLCAFDLTEAGIRIAPTKDSSPFEYGYKYLHIEAENNVGSISKLPHKNAKELGEVFNIFAQTLNNINLEKKLQ